MSQQADQYYEALSGLLNIYPDIQQQLTNLARENERLLDEKVALRRQIGAERKQNAELRKVIVEKNDDLNQLKKDIASRDRKIGTLLDELNRGPKSGRAAAPRSKPTTPREPTIVVTRNERKQAPARTKKNRNSKKTTDRERINNATDEAFRTFFGKDYEKLGFN